MIAFVQRHQFILSILFLLIVLVLANVLGGCTSPDKQYVAADGTTFDLLVPDHQRPDGTTVHGLEHYVMTDASLTEDERNDRLLVIRMWRLRIKAHGGKTRDVSDSPELSTASPQAP